MHREVPARFGRESVLPAYLILSDVRSAVVAKTVSEKQAHLNRLRCITGCGRKKLNDEVVELKEKITTE